MEVRPTYNNLRIGKRDRPWALVFASHGRIRRGSVSLSIQGGSHGFQNQSSPSQDDRSAKDRGLVREVRRRQSRFRAHRAQRQDDLSPQPARRGSQRDGFFGRAEARTVLWPRSEERRVGKE